MIINKAKCFLPFAAKMYCPPGWGAPFSEHCYLPVAEEKSWGEAQSFCKDNQSSSDLASIYSTFEDIYVRGLAQNLGEFSWIGLSDTLSEGSWVWQGGAAAQYVHWQDGEPNGDRRENCVDIGQGGWRDDNCGDKRSFICKMKATPNEDGNPSFDDSTTMPPTNNCGYMSSMWVEDPTNGMCYALIKEERTWHDAREYCKEIGTVSILKT